MHTQPDSDALSDSSRPREVPTHMVTAATSTALTSTAPTSIRRVSGEGVPLRASMGAIAADVRDQAAERASKTPRLLRHRLTAPEKRTIKRIQAQRVELFGAASELRPAPEATRTRLLQILREDRGLAQGLEASAYDTLVEWLVDESQAPRSAADVVGEFLREVGAMERPELSAPRVKSALRVLNDALYAEPQTGPITAGVREFRLEKRDGGLQVVALLRNGAHDDAVARACRAALARHDLADIDVRLVSRQAMPTA